MLLLPIGGHGICSCDTQAARSVCARDSESTGGGGSRCCGAGSVAGRQRVCRCDRAGHKDCVVDCCRRGLLNLAISSMERMDVNTTVADVHGRGVAGADNGYVVMDIWLPQL